MVKVQLEVESAQARVVAHVTSRIKRRDLKAGERLPSRTDMARELGVSPMTVRGAITELAALGYVASKPRIGVFVCDRQPQQKPPRATSSGMEAIARSTIGVVGDLPLGVSEAYYRQEEGWLEAAVVGIYNVLRDSGYHSLSLNPKIAGMRDIQTLADNVVAGMIVTESGDYDRVTELGLQVAEAGCPFVVAGNRPEFAQFDRVGPDHEQGAYELARFLIQKGRRNIALVWGSDTDRYWFASLRKGYERALHEFGLAHRPNIQSYDAPLKELDSAKRLELQSRATAGFFVEAFQGPNPPDALMAYSDAASFAVAGACRCFGKQPNVDIDITGFDNLWRQSEYHAVDDFVPLATIDKQNIRCGAELTRLLLDRMSGKLDSAPQLQLVPPRLVLTE